MAPTAKSSSTKPSSGCYNVVFFHPDLGIGGAERLVVDAAVGLQELGHKVTIFTSHCDPRHCFEEARDGTLNVRVRGKLLPPSVLNRFHILFAILRQIHLVLTIALFTDELSSLQPDVFVVDQLSACVPLLRWLFPKKQRTLFYLHFPDQLLVRDRGSGLKDLYRYPFDWFEGWSTGASDKIVVNSQFTQGVAKGVFPTIKQDFDVLYPGAEFDEQLQETNETPLWDGQYKILLSINRFERKKDIGLAIRAYAALSAAERKSTRLVVAGGYDSRVQENVHYHQELLELAGTASLKAATARTVPTALAIPRDIEVLFLLSVPGPFKETLMKNARLLLYTPSNEHFGLVPIEAMQHGLPVLASHTGGPLETVLESETGWLRDVAKVSEWTAVMRTVLYEMSPSQLEAMGNKGKKRVQDLFTREQMALRFQDEIKKMKSRPRSVFVEQKDILMALGVAGLFFAGIIAATVKKMNSFNSDARASEFARIRRERNNAGNL